MARDNITQSAGLPLGASVKSDTAWLDRFLTREADRLIPLVPTQKVQHGCGSSWDKELVPTLSHPC